MAPPNFLDETAYVKSAHPAINRSDSQISIYRTASLWLASFCRSTKRIFDEANPTHLFGSTYMGARYDITFVDSEGNLIEHSDSLLVCFYKWLNQMGTSYDVDLDGHKRVFSTANVDNINKLIQAEINSQRLSRGATKIYDAGFLTRCASYAEARARAGAHTQAKKVAAPEDNLTCYQVEVTREQAARIALNLFNNKSHTADLDVTIQASQRLSAQCGVRSQTNKTIACASVERKLYQEEGVGDVYGLQFELKGEKTKGKAAGSAHYTGVFAHINPVLSVPASVGWMLASRYQLDGRFPNLSNCEQFRTPFFEEGNSRRVKKGKDGLPDEVLGLRDPFLPDAFSKITRDVHVSLPKGVSTHWNRHDAQNQLSQMGVQSPDIGKFLNGISTKDSKVTDSHYAKVPNVLNQLILAGYGSDRSVAQQLLKNAPQFVLAGQHANALLELCHLTLPLLVSEREKLASGLTENQVLAGNKYLDMVEYSLTAFLVMCMQRPRYYDGRGGENTGRWLIDYDSECIFVRFGCNPMMSQFNHIFNSDLFKQLATEMRVLEEREKPCTPLRDSALLLSSIDRDAAVAKLIESLRGELPDDKLALVQRNATSILGGYLSQAAFETVQVELKQGAVEPKDLSRCNDFKSVLDGWEQIKTNDKDHKGWRKQHTNANTLKRKLGRYRTLAEGLPAWACDHKLSLDEAMVKLDGRMQTGGITKLEGEFTALLKRQKTA